jgi:hypothetical protein
MDKRAVEFLRSTPKTHLVATHWETPFLNFIEKNVMANFSVSSEFLNNSEVPSIGPFQAFSDYGHFVLEIPGKKTPGVEYLGFLQSTYGPEYIFCSGGEAKRCDGKFIMLSGKVSFDSTKIAINFEAPAFGERKDDQLLYRFSIFKNGTEVLSVSPWLSFYDGKKFDFKTEHSVEDKKFLRIEVMEKGRSSNFKYRDFLLKPGVVYSVE